MDNDYQLLDSGNGRKLERFGPVVLARPAAQAVWPPQRPELWEEAAASFDREHGLNWHGRERLPKEWVISVDGIRMQLSPTDFGHLGLFPETREMWCWLRSRLRRRDNAPAPRFLNLFAYSGGATLAAALAGAECCHVDAARGMVDWARKNADLNGLGDAPIRWIVDDVNKFLKRESRRGAAYDGVLLDPPSFGRGSKGELYKIESHLIDTLENVRAVLARRPRFVALTSHTPGFTPVVLTNILATIFGRGPVECGEMLLSGDGDTLPLPSGAWARWLPEAAEAAG
ncbi:MAG: class I SAM-dependent methyltransferase [Thermodesulfobacteriota bacterium]